MKKCKICNAQVEDEVTVCPVCGAEEFDVIQEQDAEEPELEAQVAEPETADDVVTEEKPETCEENTASEDKPEEEAQEEEEEPIPVVGLIIGGVIGLIALIVGLIFKFRA